MATSKRVNKKSGVKYGMRETTDSHPNQWTGTPQQEKFLILYLDPSSPTFGNAYQSAMEAGFSETYARIITSPSMAREWVKDAPRYLSLVKLGPEHIAAKLEQIALSDGNNTGDQIRALEMLAKLQGLFVEKRQNVNINIEQALQDLK